MHREKVKKKRGASRAEQLCRTAWIMSLINLVVRLDGKTEMNSKPPSLCDCAGPPPRTATGRTNKRYRGLLDDGKSRTLGDCPCGCEKPLGGSSREVFLGRSSRAAPLGWSSDRECLLKIQASGPGAERESVSRGRRASGVALPDRLDRVSDSSRCASRKERKKKGKLMM